MTIPDDLALEGVGPEHPAPQGAGNAWPLVLAGPAATMELLQAQFRATERAPPAFVRAQQQGQIARLAAHAHTHSVFWRAQIGRAHV